MAVPVVVTTKDIVELNNRGYSCQEISSRLDISHSAVYKRLWRRGIQVNVDRSKFNQDYFKNIDSEHKAYWLGFVFADGCVLDCQYKNKTIQALRIGLSSVDKEHLFSFLRDIDSDNSLCLCNEGKECRISLNSKRLVRDLKQLGCVPRKSLVLRYPNIPVEFDQHFIRGYFDGDGCISFQNGNARICILGTKHFLSVVCSKLLASNIKMSQPKQKANIFVIEGAGNRKSARMAEFLYSDASVFLQRKKDRFDAIL